MASKQILCHCQGLPVCRLCEGKGKYPYSPTEHGYMPFGCPTCSGTKILKDDDGQETTCPTCKGAGFVDPANPPTKGMWDVLTKILFGA